MPEPRMRMELDATNRMGPRLNNTGLLKAPVIQKGAGFTCRSGASIEE